MDTPVLQEETQDEGTLTHMLAKYHAPIVKYCYNLLWNHHDAQDAAQDVFFTAMRKFSNLRETSALGTWLYRIAYNTCMNMLKRKRLQRIFWKKEVAKVGAGTYEDEYNFGISPELYTALNALSPQDRALVYNRVVDQMEYCQLEEIYGVKAASLRKRYERARKKLEKMLTADSGTQEG